MRTLIQRLYTNQKYAKAYEWGKILTTMGSAQVVVQALGFISGILIIRLLPSHEYALYILATTMLANMSILADSGIKASVMSQGGKVWQNHKKLGEILSTGLYLRKRFAVGILLIALPILFYLLQNHGAGWLMSLFIAASLIPVFLASLSGSLYEVVPKLHQVIVPMQKISIEVTLGRLGLILIALFSFPLAVMAIVASGFPQLWANRRLRTLCELFADKTQKADPVIRKKILRMVTRLLPDSVYSCMAGPITIWLVSIFGSTTSVAHLGALSKLAMILTLFDIMFGTLISPRFARLPDDQKLLFKRYMQIQVCHLIVITCAILGVNITSEYLLWILGPDYAGLTKEMILMMVGSSIGFVAISNFYLCTSKGWVINPAITISVSIVSIVGGIALFDISTLKGILTFSIFTNTAMLLLHVTYGVVKIKMLKENSVDNNKLVLQ